MTAPPFEAVAIGGSAGSIEALGEILPALPASLRAAVLVVLHLPREQPSLLCQIFRHRCTLPLREIQDKEPVEPGTVYFAPPDYHVLVNAGRRLALSIDPPVHFSRPSIDVLFESAADWYGPRLMGVLLSGANADGASGLRAVQSAGGVAVVQSPQSAAVPAMPEAALAIMEPEHVLSPQGIASLLTTLHSGRLL